MRSWARYPTIYEINTWVWLNELAQKTQVPVDLSSVPSAEWDAIVSFGVDAVWLMGVWERSPAGIAIANQNDNLLADFRRALPDFQSKDNVGSPYCVRRYVVDQRLGGRAGLAKARKELADRGIRLILDFVPNHVAPDHPWVLHHPDYFIRGNAADIAGDPASFIDINGTVIANGRDPYFPSWPDVLQLNAYNPGLRAAVAQTVSDIADQCDGIRCDMAMLLMNSLFERTWGGRAGAKPPIDYWSAVIPAVKEAHPDFRFIAEAYWDMEWELQQQGFDFCYDKRLYDRLEHDNAENVRWHLCADGVYQQRLLRFLENHDEPRAAAAFLPAKERAAAVVTSTLMGARMFHEGQFDGRKVRLPVFLGRRPEEPIDAEILDFYRRLLLAINCPAFRTGDWRLCERTGWTDNRSFENIVAWTWSSDEDLYLIVVNLSDSSSQARVKIPRRDLMGTQWRLSDLMSGAQYERDGDEMSSAGLYVDLEAWNYHVLRFTASTKAKAEAVSSAAAN